jgi:hypothetical protein
VTVTVSEVVTNSGVSRKIDTDSNRVVASLTVISRTGVKTVVLSVVVAVSDLLMKLVANSVRLSLVVAVSLTDTFSGVMTCD